MILMSMFVSRLTSDERKRYTFIPFLIVRISVLSIAECLTSIRGVHTLIRILGQVADFCDSAQAV